MLEGKALSCLERRHLLTGTPGGHSVVGSGNAKCFQSGKLVPTAARVEVVSVDMDRSGDRQDLALLLFQPFRLCLAPPVGRA